jgi:formylglycine-generating enzyme required for sulfatase activity/uncharacterized caspase-like protein
MGQNWAIVVGINQYDNLRRLDYAERDAASVRDLFGEMGFEKVDFFAKDAPAIVADNGVEASAEPTFGRLSNFLRRWLASKPLTAGDTLWFFFAGHGKREGERDYLMPIDADPGNVAGTGLAVRDLTEQLRGSGAGNVILLIDACRNDGSRDGVGIGLEQQQGVITLFSCAPEQQSYEMDELQAGAFTYALLQGLRIQGEGNCATVARLAEHVRIQVPYLTQLHGKGPQNPYLVAEPASKQNLILLPKQASPTDILQLKYAASQAENQGHRDLARDFWWRVSAISNSSDMEARQAIERLASGNPLRRGAGNAGGSRSTSDIGFVRVVWRQVFQRLGGDLGVAVAEVIERLAARNFSRLNTGSSIGGSAIPFFSPMISRRHFMQLGSGIFGAVGFGLIGKGFSDAWFRKSTPQPQRSADPTVPKTPKSADADNNMPKAVKLKPFEFDTVQLSGTGKVIEEKMLERKRFSQILDDDSLRLRMVQIPAGKFLMGSQDSQTGRDVNEGPQHEVTVPEFFMAQTLVTQEQWKAVANLKKVKIDLNPVPAKFRGNLLPVEQISWWEAVEFCDRLSQYTGLTYRLPSEAEWEYACRADKKTPFYFGETITTDVANYRGTDSNNQGKIDPGNYGDGPKGKFREETTEVENFPANGWGLYDMHGNVWEWCADHWHDSYNKAPNNGSAWLTDNQTAYRVFRGGSWLGNPRECLSSHRGYNDPSNRHNVVGFRVVCVSA